MLPLIRLGGQSKGDEKVVVDRFQGVNKGYSITRIPKEQAQDATNLWLVEDGIWETRPGTAVYGPTYDKNVEGFSEYVKADGNRELIAVAATTAGPTVAKVWRVDPIAGTRTEITGATFTAGKRCFFLQISNLLYIGNGFDSLARYDGSTLTTYSALSTPTDLALTRGAGLATGAYTYYYRVSAVNAVGETLASTEVSITVNKNRDSWVATSNEFIDLNWTAVTGALRYIIYFDDVAGYGKKLAEVSTNTYRDDGTAVPNPYMQPPINDTTIGPKLGPMTLSGNRLWGIEGLPGSNRWTVYFSGTGVYLGNFAPAFGGGWIRLEFGGKARVDGIVDFQNKVHIFGSTPDGRGTIWEITIVNQEIDQQTFAVPVPTKIIASYGTNAPRAIIAVENDVIFWNQEKVSVLGNEPGILNILRVNEISRFIRDVITSVSRASSDKIAGYYWGAHVLFSIPTAAGDPNETWGFNRETGQWYGPWTIGFTQFGEFTDANGVRHLLGARGTEILEISKSHRGDRGVGFLQKYVSPRILASKDFTAWAKIRKAWARLRNPEGQIKMEIAGTQPAKPLSTLATRTIDASVSGATGIGTDIMGEFLIGDTVGIPSSFADESTIKELKVQHTIRDMQVTIWSDGVGDRWGLTGWQVSARPVMKGSPASWRT